nr:nucleotide exchange factor GrpE [Bacillus subtilis]
MSEEKQTVEQNETEEQEIIEEQVTLMNSRKKQMKANFFKTKLTNCKVCLRKKKTNFCVFKQTLKTINDDDRLEMEASQKYRSQNIVTDLLPALDSFERALQVEADNEQTKSLLQGMEMVHRQLVEALKKEGVEAIEAVGQEFDPNLHQAVMQAEDENYGSNIVVEEMQKGYKLKDRVIRPSMVKVNQ